MKSLLLLAALLSAIEDPQVADLNVGGVDDVRGYRRGVDALGYDPAAAAFADGFEFQYRQLVPDTGSSSFGIGLVAPGALTLGLGYDWIRGDSPGDLAAERGTINLAARAGFLAFGAAYRHYRSRTAGLDGGYAWDLGVFAEPSAWLSFSLGMDAVNSPRLLGQLERYSYRVGASLRPLLALPYWTLGAETRIGTADWDFDRRRLVSEFSWRTLKAFGAYDLDSEELWVGLSLALGGVEGRFATSASNPGTLRNGAAGPGTTGYALAVTGRASPEGPDLITFEEHVEVELSGDLRRPTGLLDGKEMVARLPLELHRLASDPEVGRVTLSIGGLEIGLAGVDALRSAIKEIRAAGKPVVAEIGYADEKAYMIAAAADEVRIDPSAALRIDGFAVTRRFFGATLAKLGVRFSAVAIGDYKTAPDALTRSESRPEGDEVTNELLDEVYASLISVLHEDRGFSEDEARELIDTGIYTARGAVDARLVDGLTLDDDFDSVAPPRLRGVPLAGGRPPSRRWGRPKKIAVVPVVGTIAMSSGDNPFPGDTATPSSIVPMLEEAAKDSSVQAIVVWIDSPGGGIVASDLIWRAIKRARVSKPVIAAMGNVAASGGYWVASATERIVAQPRTITGSIGIFQLKMDLSGLYEKIALTAKVDKRGELAAIGNETHGFSDAERARLEIVIDEEYDRFLGKVAAGRAMDVEEVRKLAGGRVYSGARALELGLVDELGGLGRAVHIAKSRAGVADEDVAVAIPKAGFELGRVLTRMAYADTPSLAAMVADLERRAAAISAEPMALMPFVFEVN